MARKTTSTTKAKPRKKPVTAKKEAPVASRKQRKPMFPIGTWITLLLLAALVGFTYYLKHEKETAAAKVTPTSGPAFLFDSTEGAPTSIEIKPAKGDTVKVARDAKNAWALELPHAAEADQGLAEAGASQISALQIISSIDGKLDVYGLDKPAYVITVIFANGKTHILEVGDNTPSGSGYYVREDKNKMMIVSLSGIESLLNLVNFPPYLTTPTPIAPSPTETPVPPTEATVTPTP